MTDEFPAELVARCAWSISMQSNTSPDNLARTVLRASGHAELVAALKGMVAIGKPGREQYLDGPVGTQAYETALASFNRARSALAAAGQTGETTICVSCGNPAIGRCECTPEGEEPQ